MGGGGDYIFTRGVDSFFGLGGQEKEEQIQFFLVRIARTNRTIKVWARNAPQNWKLCMFSSNFYVQFIGFVVPYSAF